MIKYLHEVQNELKAPKNQYNDFGKYKYRSAESILEAIKPLQMKYGFVTTLDDEIKEVGGRIYVVSTCRVTDIETGECFETHANAREEETKKGMDASQVTGAATSYARKYALGAMFAIDDGKDADSLNTSKEYTEDPNFSLALQLISEAETLEDLTDIYNNWRGYQNNKEFLNALSARKAQITGRRK